MKRIISVTTVLAMFAWLAPSSYACFCITQDAKTAFEQAKVVFVGEVAEIIPAKVQSKTGFILDRPDVPPVDWLSTIRFTVVRQLKGPSSDEIKILSSLKISRCMPENVTNTLRKGKQYLVYAESDEHFVHNTGGRLGIFTCGNRTGPFSKAYDDIKVIEAMPRSLDDAFMVYLSPAYTGSALQEFILSRPSNSWLKDNWEATSFRY